MPSFSGWL